MSSRVVEVCEILASHGFEQVRQRGSHVVMQRRTAAGTITVPVPDHAELRIGTLQSVIRQSSYGLGGGFPCSAVLVGVERICGMG